jgi:hypothetical protein
MMTSMAEPEPRLPVRLQGPRNDSEARPVAALHAAIGAAALANDAAARLTRALAWVAAPLGRAVLYPPFLPERLHPGGAIEILSDRGRKTLTSTGNDLDRLITAMVPAVVAEVLDTLDLNAIVRDRVDLDGLVAAVDIASVIDRVDVDAVVQKVDIDAIVSRLDIDAIADRLDLDRVLARLDVNAIVAGVDIDAIVDRINVVDLAEEVISEIDLPEIIRDSTGSMASQVVRDARMQSVDADEAISRFVDRWLRRGRQRSTDTPAAPGDGADPVPYDQFQS